MPGLDLPVARYLHPEEEVVPFRQRSELGELLRWCATAGPVAARLVAGSGGSGKTRLALRLCQELAANGWRPLWVGPGQEGLVAGAVRELGEPCVVVVDYAETRAALAGLLWDVAGLSGGPDVRVVLLARGSGEWWQRLVTGGDDQLGELLAVPPVILGPIASAEPGELFEEALTAFAGRLGAARPDVPLLLRDPRPVVLVVHAAALLAVLDHARGEGQAGASTAAEVLARVLAHESRYWAQSAAARGLGLDVAVQRLAVMAGCLIGAETQAAAAGLLARIPDLADSAERRGKVALWLHDLYPDTSRGGGPGEWIGPLRPDRVAEQLVVSELHGQPELIAGLVTWLAEDRAARALTVLARAALADPAALSLLRTALSADLEHLAVPALSVAVETNAALGGLLGEALGGQQVQRAVLERIARGAPYPSFALAIPATVVLQRLADSSSDQSERAGWLAELSVRLSDLGRREEALAASEEAARIYRQLADARPDAFLPDLAASLDNQSLRVGALGRREEALAASDEAVAIRRQLADARPDAFLPDLATSLNNQSDRLSDLGRREEALAASDEAVAIRRQLADARPDAFLPDLATSLNNQSDRLSDLGRREEALAVSDEAARIYRQLADARPDAFLPDLATSLDNQSDRLSYLGRREEALAASDEAVAIRRQLADARPDAFLPDLATSLNNQSNRLSSLGRREEALAASEEAARIYRQLADARPDAFLPDLAASLDNQSIRLSYLGRREEALAASDEAVAIRRQLADARPDAFLPDLATSLNNQSDRLSDLGRREEALAASEEATRIYRQLADAFLSDLAASLNNQSAYLWYLGRREEAVAASEEAARIYRQLADARPDAFLPDLAASLDNQSNRLSYLGRREEALAASDEAARIYRQLADARPDAFLPDLAKSLRNLAKLLGEMGRGSEALQAQAEAEAIHA